MASYLLLRDNKESGPYSLDDLVHLGLKPYDLIWVEGRSAAWRYPSEIAELKEFAPLVEEQPFDRFFKKQETESVEQLLEKRLQIEKEKKEKEQQATLLAKSKQPVPWPTDEEEQPVKPKPQPKPQSQPKPQLIEKEKEKEKEEEADPYRAYQPRPKVFVSKPNPSGNSYTTNHTNSTNRMNNLREEHQPQKQAASYSSYSAYSAASEEPVLEKKYSQSLDEIKEMYVNTLVQRKSRNRRKELARKYAKPALASVFLVICGIVIGYFVLSRKVSIEAAQDISTVTPQNQDQSSQQKKQILQPEENGIVTTTPVEKKDGKTLDQQLLLRQKSQAQNQHSPRATDAPVSSALVSTTQKQTSDPAKTEKQDVQVDPETNERNRVTRNDEVAQQDPPKENKSSISENDTKDLKRLVSVNANDYLTGIFGGIRDLRITVNNHSKYVLDAVTVQVQYIKATNQPLKTETITFKNVNPNDGETIRLPDSQRGMKVTYRITNIQSKQYQGNTAGL